MALTNDKRKLLLIVGALLAGMALFQFVSYGLVLSKHELSRKSKRRDEYFTVQISNVSLRMPLPEAVNISSVGKSLPSDCEKGLCTFFDIAIDSRSVGRVVFLLNATQRPKAAENFRALSTGEKGTSSSGTKLHYKGTKFSLVAHNILVQGGDIQGGRAAENETESIYGAGFEHEHLDEFHERGLLAMAGLKFCGSEFFITLDSVSQIDNKYAVIGKVVDGMDVVDQINAVKVNAHRLVVPVVISESGEL